MATETFKPGNTGNSSKYGFAATGMTPAQHSPFDNNVNKFPSDASSMRSNSAGDYAITIRKLAQNTSQENLESMLIFAQDLVSVDFVADKDMGHKTAIARFSKLASAQHVQSMLHGKPNTGRDANMIVEVVQVSPGGSILQRRGTMEQRDSGNVEGSTFPSQPHRQSSKFNGTFQELKRASPPRLSTFGNSDVNKQDPAYQGYFSPTSPIGQPLDRQRVSGKSMIGEDGVDDETKELLNDPMGYAQTNGGGSIRSPANSQRRSTAPHLPAAAFQSLNLNNTGMTSPPASGMMSPRSGAMMSPSGYSPPNVNGNNANGNNNMGPNTSYQYANQHYMRHNFPPINPSDQNPPCNTLYVGNLPMDTSEDELKQMFIKQRGYKRLCFRTKANGPMCFVEFEDIQTASKALTECYGLPLHNSTKGGIRLSFSKNPLGVRGGQPGNMGMTSPISPTQMGSINGYGGMQSYSSVTGPPPGLGAPPGLQSINTTNSGSMNSIGSPLGSAMNGVFSNPMSPTGAMSSLRSPTSSMGPNGWPSQNGQVPDYMMGR